MLKTMSENATIDEIDHNYDYIPIEDNEYKTEKPVFHEMEYMPCQCKYDPGKGQPLSHACGDTSECVNRLLFVECKPSECPCREFCQNQRFRKKEHPPMHVVKTKGKGFGVIIDKDMRKGDFVMEYLGEVLTQSEFTRRMRKHTSPHFYYMTLRTDEIIDASRKGNLARFINHSCDPNLETQKWIVNGRMKVGLFAIKDITSGTELSYDYKFEPYGEPQKCFCGAAKCKGIIGTKSEKNDIKAKKEENNDDDDDDDGDNENEDDENENDNDEEEEEEDSKDQNDLKDPKRNESPENNRSSPEQQHRHQRGIDSEDKMIRLLNRLLHCDKIPKIIKFLRVLEATEDKTMWRKFQILHGLQILNCLLGEHKGNLEIVRSLLRILENIAISNRNSLDELKLPDQIEVFSSHSDVIIATISKRLISKWSKLTKVYRIPKRTIQDEKKPNPDPESESTQAQENRTSFYHQNNNSRISNSNNNSAGDGKSNINTSRSPSKFYLQSNFIGKSGSSNIYPSNNNSNINNTPKTDRNDTINDGFDHQTKGFRDNHHQGRNFDGGRDNRITSHSNSNKGRNWNNGDGQGKNSSYNGNYSNYGSSKGSSSTWKQASPKETQFGDQKSGILPINWKSHTLDNGETYYYHSITKNTQWDWPSAEDVKREEAQSISIRKSSIHNNNFEAKNSNPNQDSWSSGNNPSSWGGRASSSSAAPTARIENSSKRFDHAEMNRQDRVGYYQRQSGNIIDQGSNMGKGKGNFDGWSKGPETVQVSSLGGYLEGVSDEAIQKIVERANANRPTDSLLKNPTSNPGSASTLNNFNSVSASDQGQPKNTSSIGGGTGASAGGNSRKRPLDSPNASFDYSANESAKRPSSSAIPKSSSSTPNQQFPKFKEEISAFVVAYLSKYKDEILAAPDLDFKNLARKLTHTIMDKEIRAQQEKDSKAEPSFGENVKAKAKKYMKSYLIRSNVIPSDAT